MTRTFWTVQCDSIGIGLEVLLYRIGYKWELNQSSISNKLYIYNRIIENK